MRYALPAVARAIARASSQIIALLWPVDVALWSALPWQGPARLIWRSPFERVVCGPGHVTGTIVIAEGFVLVATLAYVAIDVVNFIDGRGWEGIVVVIIIVVILLVLFQAPAGTVRVEDPLGVHVLGVDWPGLLADCAVNVSTEVLSERRTVVVAVMELSRLGSWLDLSIASAHGKGIVSWWLDPGVRWP